MVIKKLFKYLTSYGTDSGNRYTKPVKRRFHFQMQDSSFKVKFQNLFDRLLSNDNVNY